MRPEPGQVLHFSEDPEITRFVPHAAATAKQPEPYVWAVDALRAPDYWFPRDCPRLLAWVQEGTGEADRDWCGGGRVHVVEYAWLRRLMAARLYAYRLPAGPFRPFGDPVHAHVAIEPVEPLGPAEPVGDLLAVHEAAGIELRMVHDLWPAVDRVVGSTLGFSGIRLRNARPRR